MLQELRSTDFAGTPAYWEHLANSRHAPVVVIYPQNLSLTLPPQWTLVGEWRLHRKKLTAFSRDFKFYATSEDQIIPLAQHLRQFAPTLPDGESLIMSVSSK